MYCIIVLYCIMLMPRPATAHYLPLSISPPSHFLLIYQHDATPCHCSFNLTIMDTLKGLYLAKRYDFFSLTNFNLKEYVFYEQVMTHSILVLILHILVLVFILYVCLSLSMTFSMSVLPPSYSIISLSSTYLSFFSR